MEDEDLDDMLTDTFYSEVLDEYFDNIKKGFVSSKECRAWRGGRSGGGRLFKSNDKKTKDTFKRHAKMTQKLRQTQVPLLAQGDIFDDAVLRRQMAAFLAAPYSKTRLQLQDTGEALVDYFELMDLVDEKVHLILLLKYYYFMQR